RIPTTPAGIGDSFTEREFGLQATAGASSSSSRVIPPVWPISPSTTATWSLCPSLRFAPCLGMTTLPGKEMPTQFRVPASDLGVSDCSNGYQHRNAELLVMSLHRTPRLRRLAAGVAFHSVASAVLFLGLAA